MGGGAVVVAAAAHKRRLEFVLDAFRGSDATAPERARTFEQLGIIENMELDQLRRAGVVLPGVEPETWYLSERAYTAHRARVAARARRVAVAALVLVGLAIVVVAVVYGVTRHTG